MELLKKAGAEAEKLLKYLEDLFRTHPTADALHVTADQQFFLDKSQANNYALRLPDKAVATVTRTDFEAAGTEGQTRDEVTEDAAAPASATDVTQTTVDAEGAKTGAEQENGDLAHINSTAVETSQESDSETPVAADKAGAAEEQVPGDKTKR
jgi:hypothetical protein